MRAARSLAASFLVLYIASAPASAADSRGTVHGRVSDADGNALPGCAVGVEGSAAETQTATDGSFTLAAVPAGRQSLHVTCLGFEDTTAAVEVIEGSTVRADVPLAGRLFREEVTVSAYPLLEGQAKALNQQMTAINIKNIVAADLIGSFPDPNAAEATQRIPGVTLQRDQGEGRYIIVRGTEPRLTGSMINGERIPSPEGDTRYVALDVVPADLLEAIEVSKAITPDMDGDSIGGAVNLVTKRSPAQGSRLNVTAAAGYNDISDDDILQGNASWGARLGPEDRIGLLLAASHLRTDRGSENFEVSYDDGDLDSLEFRDYSIRREREGYNFDLDAQPSDRGTFFARGIWNDFADQEFRHRKTEGVADERIERELKDRYEEQQIISGSIGGERILGGGGIVDYSASYHHAEEDEPASVYSIFRQEDVEFDPNVSAEAIDDGNVRANPLNESLSEFFLDGLEFVDAGTEDDDAVGGANMMLPLGESARGFWKVGAKYRAKEKSRDNRLDVASPEDDVFLEDFVDPDFDGGAIIDGRYTMGPFQGRAEIDRLLSGSIPFETENDLEEELADYDAQEDTLAAYGMAEWDLSPEVRLLGGLRWETSDSEYSAFELVLDEDGDPESLSPVSGTNDQDELLPMAHLVWDLGGNANLRAAATRTMARPNFSDLAPFQLVLRDDVEIERGNPELDWTTATNLDLLYEKYFTSVGVVSAGVFYKDLTDNIFLFHTEEIRDGEEFDVTQPLNGGGAELLGAELAYQNRLASLPAPFDGLGIFFNLTLTDSNAELAGRPDFDLVGQAGTSGNLAISYEKGGFSGRLSLNHHDDYISEVADDPAGDIYVDEHQQLDFSASQRLTSKVRLFLELINLTDEPFRVYEGSANRPIQEEYYSWWGTLGVKVTL